KKAAFAVHSPGIHQTVTRCMAATFRTTGFPCGANMEFTVKNAPVAKQRSACIVVGVYEPRKLSTSAAELDQVSRGYIVNILKRGDMKTSPGQALWLYDVPKTSCDRILLIGCGDQKTLDEAAFRAIVRGMATALRGAGLKEAFCCLPELEVQGRDMPW